MADRPRGAGRGDPGGAAVAPTGAAIFLNRGAGSARTERVQRTVELARRALDADLHVIETRDPNELAEFLRARVGAYSTAVIAGGDGTLGMAFGLVGGRTDLALGYIPAGFGNATSHLLGLPREPDALAAVLASGDARPVDLVLVDGRLAFFAGSGWDAVVAGRYAASGARRFAGWAGAIAGSMPDLFRRYPVEVRADGWVVHRGPMEMLVVSTTPFYGRGLRVNPGARLDAGTLSLRVYRGPAPQLAAEVARWALRVAPRARRIDARHVEVRMIGEQDLPLQIDGDLIGARREWTFDVRPAAVRLIGRWS